MRLTQRIKLLAFALVTWLPAGPAVANGNPLQGLHDMLMHDYPIKGWQLVLLVLAALPLIWLAGQAVSARMAPWRRYRKDRFLGMVWRWTYAGGQPDRIWCFCPEDDTQLIYSYSQIDNEVVFRCETCGRDFGAFAGDQDYVRGIIRRQINRKLRTGEWRNELPTAEDTADG